MASVDAARPAQRRGAKVMTCVHRSRTSVFVFTLVVSGCAVGPNYHRPEAQTPPVYKELAGWKPATPADTRNRGAWWSIYDDAQLDALERQVSLSNQNVQSYEAQYQEAEALVRETSSGLFPTLGVTADATRNGGSSTTVVNSAGTTSSHATQYELQSSASWTPDVWGSIRRQLESRKAAAQMSAADLANALLSAQATLAQDYFELREEDSMEDLLQGVVRDYQRTVQITRAQYEAGTASRGDYVSALAQLQSARTQLTATRQARGQYEHAIAVLTGAPPAGFSIASGALSATVPVVPVGVPSTLLERNPAIAAAERQMKSENALIGAAEAAYFPTVTLSGLIGFASGSLGDLVSTANRVWSLGGSAAQTLFDAGERSAEVTAARANYDEAVASYRQTVLSTFQSVEDQLLALHTLQDEIGTAAAAVDSAKQAADVALAEYQAGTVAFTTVLTADETFLQDRQTLLSIQQSQLVASVTLIEALGGGWSVAAAEGTKKTAD
jgi:NodT family efflux transporter outer membrane factor (OMF) lipoprotein